MSRFDPIFIAEFERLLLWRRDVRGFRADPVAEDDLAAVLAEADLAPSVGLSQPWRFVLMESQSCRDGVRANFANANAQALAEQEGERAALYARLKLAGLDRAPVQIAVFCDESTRQGHGLGRATMPETLAHSTAMAIHTLWLSARARGLGVGWVSILDPVPLNALLAVPAAWRFVAYLTLGYPEVESDVPALERAGWEKRAAGAGRLLRR